MCTIRQKFPWSCKSYMSTLTLLCLKMTKESSEVFSFLTTSCVVELSLLAFWTTCGASTAWSAALYIRSKSTVSLLM